MADQTNNGEIRFPEGFSRSRFSGFTYRRRRYRGRHQLPESPRTPEIFNHKPKTVDEESSAEEMEVKEKVMNNLEEEMGKKEENVCREEDDAEKIDNKPTKRIKVYVRRNKKNA